MSSQHPNAGRDRPPLLNIKSWPSRLYALDFSRGLAALAVVVWHWQHFGYAGTVLSTSFVRADQPFYPVLKILYEAGLNAVEYFFLLSGFIFFWLYREAIETRALSFKNFWVDRISRLYPLHLVALLIVAGLQRLYIAHNAQPFVYKYNDTYHFLLNFFFAQRWGFESGWSFNGPEWSVSLEILLYLLFFALAFAKRGRAMTCLYISLFSFFLNILGLHAVFRGASLFFLGGFALYATQWISARPQTLLKSAVYFTALLAWALTFTHFYVVDLARPLQALGGLGELFIIAWPTYILYPFTVCALALYEIERGPRWFKSVAWVGDITYAAYLLHFPLQLLIALAISYGLLSHDFYLSPLALLAYMAALIPLSYQTFVRFERPVQRRIRERFLGKTSGAH